MVAHAAELSDDLGPEQLMITELGRSLGIAPPGVYRLEHSTEATLDRIIRALDTSLRTWM